MIYRIEIFEKLTPMYGFCSSPVFALALCFVLANVSCSKQEPTTTTAKLAPPSTTQPLAEQEITAQVPEEKTAPAEHSEIAWTDLLPSDDLLALENPPEYLDDIEDGSESDVLASQLKAEPSAATFSESNGGSGNNTDSKNKNSASEVRYQQALSSTKIRPEFNGRAIRIPGFIVPLEFDDHQTITTFFLVPFFGACLHMPPPPPNQIIYAEFEPGIRLEALYDPFWINGTLSTTLVENDMATAAYSISVNKIEPYTESYTEPPAQDWGQNTSNSVD